MTIEPINRPSLFRYMTRWQGVCTCEVTMRFCMRWDDAVELLRTLEKEGEVRETPSRTREGHVTNWSATGAGEHVLRQNVVEPHYGPDKDVTHAGRRRGKRKTVE